jgi:hypothetical protein
VYQNERDITGTKTVLGNLTSYVKAVVSPLLDIFRHNHKEYTLDAARIYGNMQAQIPSKPTTYDPVTGAMRTTVREQLDDAPRQYGNMQAQIPSKPTTYDPVLGVMRTTIKEQTIHDTNIANPRGLDAPPVEADDDARKTMRETLPVVDTMLNVSAHKYNVTVYDVDAVAKTTIRQTTPASGSMYGFIDATDGTGAYSVIDVAMKPTQKAFVSDHEYTGSGESQTDFRPMSQDAAWNAEIDGTREAMHLAAGNTPAAGGAFTGVAKDQIDVETKKIMGDSIASRRTGNTRGVQMTARQIDASEITRIVQRENSDERLNGDVLASLVTNPYSININPINL